MILLSLWTELKDSGSCTVLLGEYLTKRAVHDNAKLFMGKQLRFVCRALIGLRGVHFAIPCRASESFA